MSLVVGASGAARRQSSHFAGPSKLKWGLRDGKIGRAAHATDPREAR
jgi:hypothetical protein